MNRLVCEAISKRLVLSFEYEDGGQRLVEPHCHGFNVNRTEVLRGYQLAGSSSTGATSGWKVFIAGKMRNVSLTSTSVTRHRDRDEAVDAGMIVVDCRLTSPKPAPA